MKAFLNFIVLVLLVNHSYTQETSIKLAQAFSLMLEKKITDNASWQVGAGYTTYSFFGQTTILTFSGGIRFYTRQDMQGIYAYPLFTIANVDSESSTLFGALPTLTTEDFISYGIVLGRQWFIESGLTI
jgi:hypothetical protein